MSSQVHESLAGVLCGDREDIAGVSEASEVAEGERRAVFEPFAVNREGLKKTQGMIRCPVLVVLQKKVK